MVIGRWEGEDLSVDKDKSIVRSLQLEGEGHESPNDGASVTLDLVGSVAGRVFREETDLKFVCGEASEVRRLLSGSPLSSLPLGSMARWGYPTAWTRP